MDEDQLRNFLITFLKKNGYQVIIENGSYIFAEGDCPICLLAHMDTVFNSTPNYFYYDQEQDVLWHPGGSGFDDRAGIFAIITLIHDGYRPHIIFTDLEEIGGIGARQLIKDYPKCPFDQCKALIQLDRANKNDCVFYNCINNDFADFIEKYGFEFAFGIFTDISIIAPKWKIAAVNLSVGYEDEHLPTERLHVNWLFDTIDKVSKILDDIDSMPFYEYIEEKPKYEKIDDEFDCCVFCGIPFKHNHKNIINLAGYSYAVCDVCKNLYL